MEILDKIKELVEQIAGHHISYSEQEAAERLGFKVCTLRSLRKSGKITFSCVASRIRYTPEHLDSFLKKHEVKAR